MSHDHSDSLEHLPLAALAIVHEVCERFEQKLRTDGSASLDEFLSQIPLESQRAGFRELLGLKVDYERSQGRTPSLNEYISRYPERVDTLNSLWHEAPQSTSIPFSPPAALGGYRIIREIGRGGMGIVYLAEQSSLVRQVAIKVLTGATILDPVRYERFQREARSAAALQHPGIVPVYDVGSQDGLCFYVMRFVEGLSLDRIIQSTADDDTSGSFGRYAATPARGRENLQGRQSSTISASDRSPPALSSDHTLFRNIARIMQQATSGLQHAHEEGILHRDIKPSNLILDRDGKLWITDFGLAKSVSETQSLTRTGDVGGTLKYMAPESISGKGEFKSDIYGLGLTLYELLAGCGPYTQSEPARLIDEIVHGGSVMPPRKINPRVPRDLETICLKCVQKDVSARYRTAAAVGEDLQRFINNEPILARRIPVWTKFALWARRKPVVAALSTLAVVMTFGALVGLSWGVAARAEQVRSETARANAEAANRQMATERAAAERVARAQEESLRRSVEATLVYSRVALAESSWAAGEISAARRFLALCIPKPNEVDHRGWEWDYVNGLCNAEVHVFQHRFWVNAVAFHPDGRFLATGAGSPGSGVGSQLDDSELKIWNLATGKEVATLVSAPDATAAIQTVSFSDSGRWLLAKDARNHWHIWQTDEWQRVTTLMGITAGFLPNSDALAVFDLRGQLWHYHLPDFAAPVTIGEPADVGVQATGVFSSDRQFVSLRASDRRRAFVSNTQTGVPASIDASNNPLGGHTALTKDYLVDGSNLWHVPTGRMLGCLGDGIHPIYQPVFSPDGAWLTWTMEPSSELCINSTGAEISPRRFRGHTGEINCITFNAAGDHIATASADKTVRIWDRDGRQLQLLRGHTAGVRDVVFGPKGTNIASASQDGTVRVWNSRRDPRSYTVNMANGRGETVTDVSFSADGLTLVVADWNAVTRLNIQTSKRELHLRTLLSTSFTAAEGTSMLADHGRLIVAATESEPQIVKVWDTLKSHDSRPLHSPDIEAAEGDANGLLHRLKGHTFAVRATAADKNGDRFASLAYDRDSQPTAELIIWNPAAQERMLNTIPGTGLMLSRNGRLLAMAGIDGKIYVWNANTGLEQFQLSPTSSTVTHMSFSDDSTLLAASTPEEIMVWETATGQMKFTLQPSSSSLTCVTFSPDGQRLATVGIDEGVVQLWDAATGENVSTLRPQVDSRPNSYGYFGRVVFSADGRRIAANNWNSSISVWDAEPLVKHHVENAAAQQE